MTQATSDLSHKATDKVNEQVAKVTSTDPIDLTSSTSVTTGHL